MDTAREKTNAVVDYSILVVVTMFSITIVYMVAEKLAGQVPAKIGAFLLGIAGIYILVAGKKTKEDILSWLRNSGKRQI